MGLTQNLFQQPELTFLEHFKNETPPPSKKQTKKKTLVSTLE